MLAEIGEKPDALLITRERYTAHENVSQGEVTLDGSENASVQFANCCRPVPGDAIVGYLGRGEGLVVHCEDCAVARRLQHKDSERFISVEWADEPVRPFETSLLVTVINGKGVLARVAAALASAEADITHVDMCRKFLCICKSLSSRTTRRFARTSSEPWKNSPACKSQASVRRNPMPCRGLIRTSSNGIW